MNEKQKNTVAIVGALVVVIVIVVVVWMLFFKKTAAGATQPTTSPSTAPGVSNQTYSVTVSATDAKDPYQRAWQIQTPNGVVVTSQTLGSGQTMNVSLAAGTYYLAILQTGGSAYGTYSGTITTPNQTSTFAGLDNLHAAEFTVP